MPSLSSDSLFTRLVSILSTVYFDLCSHRLLHWLTTLTKSIFVASIMVGVVDINLATYHYLIALDRQETLLIETTFEARI